MRHNDGSLRVIRKKGDQHARPTWKFDKGSVMAWDAGGLVDWILWLQLKQGRPGEVYRVLEYLISSLARKKTKQSMTKKPKAAKKFNCDYTKYQINK